MMARLMPLARVLVTLSLCALPLVAAPSCRAAGAADAAAAAGGSDGSLAAARAAVAEKPDSVPALVRLGYQLLAANLPEEAMRQFDHALQVNPRAYDAKTGRGAVLARTGKLPEAEQELRGALHLNPNPVRTHYELGLVYQKMGAYDKAVAQFKEGIKKHEQGRN